MSRALLAASRISALVLALAVAVHLVVIIGAVQENLTAGAVLARTAGNRAFLAFYLCFVFAAAVHAPIGLRTAIREWLGCSGRLVDGLLICFAVLLAVFGVRAAFAVFLA